MTHVQKSLLMCTLAGLSLSTSFYVPTHATEVSAPTTAAVSATQAPSQVQPSDSKPLMSEPLPQRSYFSYIKSSIAPLLKFCGMCYFGFLTKNNLYRSRHDKLAVPLYANGEEGQAVKVPHDHKPIYFHLSILQAFVTAYLAKSLYSDYCNYQQSKSENQKQQNTNNSTANITQIASQSPAPSSHAAPAVAQ